MKKYKILTEEWVKLYLEGLKINKIAALYKCKSDTVGKYLKKAGIKAKKGGQPAETTLESILSKLIRNEETGCLEWPSPRNTRGYGMVSYKNRNYNVHRIVFILLKGEIPIKLQVLHKCDNPPCANIDHLYLGDYKDNSRDALARNRLPQAKLCENQVREILTILNAGNKDFKGIAKQYKVSKKTIRAIYKGTTWKYIDRSEYGINHS